MMQILKGGKYEKEKRRRSERNDREENGLVVHYFWMQTSFRRIQSRVNRRSRTRPPG
jgi:hypothetical protein